MMPTREQLLNPKHLVTGGTLRWLRVGGHHPKLQVYNSTAGEWQDVPVVTQAELDERFID